LLDSLLQEIIMNFLKPGKLPLLSIVRYKRRDCHKLKKPEDKSSIILGKYKETRKDFAKPGVSDKASPIHVKWERPVMIETVNPEISGDVGGLNHFGLDQMDLSKPKLEFENSSALKTASKDVQRVLSLEFARRRNVVDKLTQDVLKSVQRHPQDFGSLEVKITMQTIRIRNMQQHLYDLYPYKNQPVKHVLTHIITSRRKNLGRLREQDYKKYEWLLEKLNLLYKPMPHDTPDGVLGEKENVARKASIEKLTDIWCSELRRHRLKALERKLQEAQPEFLRRKAEKLQFILEEERDLNLEPTVTQAEIDQCLEQADTIQQQLDNNLNTEEEFLIYKEEIKEPSLLFHAD